MKKLSEKTPEQVLIQSPFLDSFHQNVKISEDDLGVGIHCRLGLWGVFAPTMEQALKEAQHYYLQYYSDGEYNRK